MKASRIVLLLPVAFSIFLWGVAQLPSGAELESGELLFLEEDPVAVSIEPMPSCTMEETAVVGGAKVPMQPLGERGDTMLFECEALYGTLFGHTIAMPFD